MITAKKSIMKTTITIITAIIMVGSTTFASAEGVPAWIKNNAGWWADGIISESEFIQGIQFLIKENVIVIPPTTVSAEKSQSVPEWIKNNAGWWADGTITDKEFVNGIQHLIKTGVISVSAEIKSPESLPVSSDDSKLASLEAELEKCAEIKQAYSRLNCERAAKHAIEVYTIIANGQSYNVGPLIYYWTGLETEGNSFEISESGQAILSIRILAVNTSNDNVSMMCTGPAVCNYDVWNGDKAFKYSGMDFTNGQIVVKPGTSEIFNMLFGPNIGYGGTTFEYDSSKEYFFRISEPYGKMSIPLGLP